MLKIKDIITASLAKVSGISLDDVALEVPENETFGDYSSNVALQLRSAGSPVDKAQKIVEKLKEDKVLKEVVEKIEVAGPGFINFWISKDVLLDNLTQIDVDKENYGKNNHLKGKRIMFEYGQPNTHKLPHIGHLFNYIYGESVTRILVANGAMIYHANYQGDVGLHVAKCLWAFKKNTPDTPKDLEEKVNLLQKMYQEGSAAYEDSEDTKKEIQLINKQIYEKDPEIMPIWEETRGWSVSYYKRFEERLGINFDRYYYESEVYKEGIDVVKQNLGKVFKESQGAIIFEGSKYGLHDRVFITQYGTPTYEAKDLYLEDLKFKEWPFDLLVITTANEQDDYFKVVYKAVEIINPKLVGKLKHIGFGMVNLKSGKMSSRTGNIISAVDLVNTVIDKVSELGSKGKAAETVGIGAIKYSFLKNNPLQNTIFSIEESIAAEGNSGPYMQYTYARANSILNKASKKKEIKDQMGVEEELLLRTLIQYPGIITSAAKTYSPNTLANYLFSLAQKFNNFYNTNRVLGSDKEDLRLEVTRGIAQVLKNGLELLGIEAPEKM